MSCVNKTCTKCKVEYPITNYAVSTVSKYTGKTIYRPYCKSCGNAVSKAYRKNNKEKVNNLCKLWRLNNKEKSIKSTETWRKNNQEKFKAKKRELNVGRKRYVKIRTPKWLTKEQKQEISKVYRLCPPGYHVDHIVPLRGSNVSGLHVPWNLQYLTAEDNMKKRNKYELSVSNLFL